MPLFYAATLSSVGANGISCFIVEKESEGLSFGNKEEKVIYDNVSKKKKKTLRNSKLFSGGLELSTNTHGHSRELSCPQRESTW